MTIFEFKDYKQFVRHMINTQPVLGRGSVKRMAEALRVHPSLISQVLKGTKEFTAEQANDVAVFLNLNELETECFLCLVDIERAGTSRLKTFLQNKRDRLVLSARGTEVAANAPASSGAGPAGASGESKFSLLGSGIKDRQSITEKHHDLIEDLPGDNDSDAHGATWRMRALHRIRSETALRRSLTISVTMSEKNSYQLQDLIDEFVTKIKDTMDPAVPENFSVVTIDLFDLA